MKNKILIGLLFLVLILIVLCILGTMNGSLRAPIIGFRVNSFWYAGLSIAGLSILNLIDSNK